MLQSHAGPPGARSPGKVSRVAFGDASKRSALPFGRFACAQATSVPTCARAAHAASAAAAGGLGAARCSSRMPALLQAALVAVIGGDPNTPCKAARFWAEGDPRADLVARTSGARLAAVAHAALQWAAWKLCRQAHLWCSACAGREAHVRVAEAAVRECAHLEQALGEVRSSASPAAAGICDSAPVPSLRCACA